MTLKAGVTRATKITNSPAFRQSHLFLSEIGVIAYFLLSKVGNQLYKVQKCSIVKHVSRLFAKWKDGIPLSLLKLVADFDPHKQGIQAKAKEIIRCASAQEINRATGISRSTITDLKSGRRSFESVHFNTAQKLASLYDNINQTARNKWL